MEESGMRSGKLRLVGVAVAVAVFGATGCDRPPGEGGQARTETDTQAEPGRATPAPEVGVSGGTAAGADTADTTAVTPTARRDTATPAPKPPAAPKDTTAARQTTTGTPGKTVTQVEYTGWKQYEVNCARCHGEYGLGSTIAPSLYHSFQSGAVDSAEFQRVVHGSRTPKGMPNWTGMLSEEYLHAIYKYLSGRGAGRIAAGRPTPEG
jgi:mono/diheme cytochrome c family protein